MMFEVGHVASGGDPFFAQVVLLMHCEGADGGTTFIDSSSYAHTIQLPVAGITTSITTADVGLASAKSPLSTSGYLRVDEIGSEFNIDTSECTIQYSGDRVGDGLASGTTLLTNCVNGAGGQDKLRIARTTGAGQMTISHNGATPWSWVVAGTPFANNDGWHKFALEIWNNAGAWTYSFYKDGTRIDQSTQASGLEHGTSWNIFTNVNNGDGGMAGYMDEIRITNAARFHGAASYTTQSTPFSDN